MGVFFLVSIGDVTGWEELIPIGLVPKEATVSSMGNSNDVRGRVELEVVFNKIWVSRVN